MKVGDQGCGFSALPNIVQVLLEAGEYRVLCFSDIMFIAEGAGNYINDVGGIEGKGAQTGKAGSAVGIVQVFPVYVEMIKL